MKEPAADRWAITAAKSAIAIMVLAVIAVIFLNAKLSASGHQVTNTNLAAPFSALGFLGGMAAFVVALVVVGGAMLSGHRTLARAMAAVAAIEVVLYAAMLVGYSRRSHEVVLGPGQEKYFCELDCHIAYTIGDVERDGENLRVALRTRFDERTIAPWRGDGTLSPSPRVIELVDASGHVYRGRQAAGPALTTPLRPGESYTTEYVFDVPPGVSNPRLLVLTAGEFPERMLIGNENSFLHRKIYFRL